MTVVYIDSLALLNFLINYLLLLASVRVNGIPFRRLRIMIAALFGALYAVLVWLPGMIFLSGWFWKLVFCALMVTIAFWGVKPSRLIKLGVTFVGASFLLGGLVVALGYLVGAPLSGGAPYMPVDFKTLFLTAGLSYGLLTLAFRHMARHGARETAEVAVLWEDRRIQVRGLLDSGHTLSDPISGAEVLILGTEAALRLFPPRAAALIDPSLLGNPTGVMELMGSLGYGSRFRLIPYRAVGTECGFLLAFRPDRTEVGGRSRKGCLIGVSPTPLAAGTGVEALVSTL